MPMEAGIRVFILLSAMELLVWIRRVGCKLRREQTIQLYCVRPIGDTDFIGVPDAGRQLLLVRIGLLAGPITLSLYFVDCAGPIEK